MPGFGAAGWGWAPIGDGRGSFSLAGVKSPAGLDGRGGYCIWCDRKVSGGLTSSGLPF